MIPYIVTEYHFPCCVSGRLPAILHPMRYGWLLDADSWKELDKHLSSLVNPQWKRVRLHPTSQDSVPQRPGTYLIVATPAETYSAFPEILNNALYVGQATNLRTRFLNHCNSPASPLRSAKLCFGRLDFTFLRMPSAYLHATEASLIRCLGPAANRQAGSLKATIGPPEPA